MSTEFEIEVLSKLDTMVNYLSGIHSLLGDIKVSVEQPVGEIMATEPLEQTLKKISDRFSGKNLSVTDSSMGQIIAKLQNAKQQMENLDKKLDILKQDQASTESQQEAE